MDIFVARFQENGRTKSIGFRRSQFDEAKASQHLKNKGVENFFFFFEPSEPLNLDDNTIMFTGDVGFDITVERLLPYINDNKTIIIDSYGGALYEGLKAYDIISQMAKKPEIGIIGNCMSAATLFSLSTDNNWISENSRYLIHNASWLVEGDNTDHQKAADYLTKENENAARIYARHTGMAESDVLALMKEERIMLAKEAFDKGFVSKIKYNNLNENTMKKEDFDAFTQKQESAMEKIMNMFSSFAKPKPKNLMLTSLDGVAIDFQEVETLEEVVVGTLATVDGVPATGEYAMPNDKTYVFEGGAVTEIKDAGNDSLQEENEALTEEVANLKMQLNNNNMLIRNIKDELEASKKALIEFKTSFSTDAPIVNTPASTEPKKKEAGFKFNIKK